MDQISESKFRSLLKRVEDLTKAASEKSGEAGELVAKAIDREHLHRKAFSMFRQLRRMSPEKLVACLEAFDYYREIGGLDEIAASAPTFEGTATVMKDVTPKKKANNPQHLLEAAKALEAID